MFLSSCSGRHEHIATLLQVFHNQNSSLHHRCWQEDPPHSLAACKSSCYPHHLERGGGNQEAQSARKPEDSSAWSKENAQVDPTWWVLNVITGFGSSAFSSKFHLTD